LSFDVNTKESSGSPVRSGSVPNSRISDASAIADIATTSEDHDNVSIVAVTPAMFAALLATPLLLVNCR